MTAPILIDGGWRDAPAIEAFRAFNPAEGVETGERYPVTSREVSLAACDAAGRAADAMRDAPGAQLARFLDDYAARIEARADEICRLASTETALPYQPRLRDVELPRTTGQLRQAASAAREGSWRRAVIDTKLNIRSCYRPLGPVFVLGPNNFPLAFNAISGGDFAAAVAAGCPVLCKGHPGHPGTTRLLTELAHEASRHAGLPAGAIQLLYHVEPETGLEILRHPAIRAVAFTGSRPAGMRLKRAAEEAGKLAYLEMSSVNPVFLLPGALEERADEIAGEFTASCLMGVGQFCTNPGLVVALAGEPTERFLAAASEKLRAAGPGVLFSRAGVEHLERSIAVLTDAGAEVILRGPCAEQGFACRSALLRTSGRNFLSRREALLTEAFGPASLLIVAEDADEAVAIARNVGGNLTGCVYSAADGRDDDLARRVSTALEPNVGRIMNDKMPTGVAVSPAMVHGGPYPATGHPGFTAVGIPASIARFGALVCYDNVRQDRLPPLLLDDGPGAGAWRCTDGEWKRS